jgi:hypothetical protein
MDKGVVGVMAQEPAARVTETLATEPITGESFSTTGAVVRDTV